jgi:beta-galactosidase GanA
MNSAFYAGGFMPCFDNPDVIGAGTTFVKKLVERFRSHPALWCYNAWNEPRSRPLGQCQCEHSKASYRAWLKSEFGTIEELNAKLHKAWESFDTIIPPASEADIIEMFLWRQWAAHAVSRHVGAVCDVIREVDPDGFIMMHSGACDVTRDPIVDTCDDQLMAPLVERYGMSLNIPHFPKTPIDYHEAEYQSSWVRRMDPEYWCHEFYPNSSDWSRSTPPRNLARHIWMALAGGCAGLTFWEHRSVRNGIRSNGFGVREIDGSESSRSKVCDGIAAVLKNHGETLAQSRRVSARVGLLFSKKCDMVHRIIKMQSWMGNLQNAMPDVDYGFKQALRGAHAAYQVNGEDVDWVVSGDDLADVSLLHVTSAEMIEEADAEWLRNYVREGGSLVVEFPFACRDWKTWIHLTRPGHGLEDLIGCSELTREVVNDDPHDIATFTNGLAVDARGWRIALEPKGGVPIAHWQDGSVAGVVNRYGKGKVCALGVNASISSNNSWDDPVFDVFRWLLDGVGFSCRPWYHGRDVWIRRRHGSGSEIWFVFNVSETVKRINLPAVPTSVWYQEEAQQIEETAFEVEPGATLVVEMARADA